MLVVGFVPREIWGLWGGTEKERDGREGKGREEHTANSTSTSSRSSASSSNLERIVSRYSSASSWYWPSLISAACASALLSGTDCGGGGSSDSGIRPLWSDEAVDRKRAWFCEAIDRDRRTIEGRSEAVRREVRPERLCCRTFTLRVMRRETRGTDARDILRR